MVRGSSSVRRSTGRPQGSRHYDRLYGLRDNFRIADLLVAVVNEVDTWAQKTTRCVSRRATTSPTVTKCTLMVASQHLSYHPRVRCGASEYAKNELSIQGFIQEGTQEVRLPSTARDARSM